MSSARVFGSRGTVLWRFEAFRAFYFFTNHTLGIGKRIAAWAGPSGFGALVEGPGVSVYSAHKQFLIY